ncbi:MAG: Cache 3/Cache 2 fusion domain-containing protein [Thiomargarita sp.]|nr:Cache 3/Cache 2 fusion domain-containing protein [Thiomargarita sp.]
MCKKHIFKILLFFCGISFLTVWFLIYHYVHEKNQSVQIAKNHAQQETLQAAQQIDQLLNELSSIAHVIADEISSGHLKREHILNRLKNLLKTTPNLFGIGVAFIPYVNNPQIRQLSPYYVNRKGGRQPKQELLQVFTVPITYFDRSKQSKIITGVVFIDYPLNKIKALMASLKLGRNGYGFILSKKGVFIAHPIDDYVKNYKTIFNLAESYHDHTLWRLGEKAINGESGAINYIDRMTGQSAWIFYQFIPSTHWSMGVVFFNKEVLETTYLRRQLIWICIATIFFLILLSIILFRADKGNNISLWKVVYSSTMILMGGVSYLWYITQTAPFHKEVGSTMIVDQVGLQQFLSTLSDKNSLKKLSLIYVPTGVFIDSIAFLDHNIVNFSGYIWQKYVSNTHDHLSRGFILPEAKTSKIVETYHITQNNTEIIGWHFQARVPHQFDYSKYPFDRRELKLRIAHQDFDKNVILTPDLAAYGVTNPSARSGIKREVVLSGWLVLKSFFNYQHRYENTNLGIEGYLGHRNFSHLHFKILVKRKFLAPFLSNILPLFIATALLFALQMWLGKTTTFIRSLNGLFFGILLAHIRLRGTLRTPEIVYIEYFYLIVYCSLLITTISFFLFEYKVRISYYRKGLILKLLFWPIIVVSSFVITVVVFYV